MNGGENIKIIGYFSDVFLYFKRICQIKNFFWLSCIIRPQEAKIKSARHTEAKRNGVRNFTKKELPLSCGTNG
ncbi:MAG: hypothetical protein IKC59_08470, partial [Clostridia bacterium]|nr:hypothetical protein [Clostridia bacterium]